MKAEEILEVIDKLNTPDAIIQQTERTKTIKIDKKEIIVRAPDNFAVFVTLDSGKECVAIVEFDSTIESKYIVKDVNGEKFHTTVTVFKPDVIKDGLAFDYLEYLLLNSKNRELEIIKESPKSKTAYGEILATVSDKGLSVDSISQLPEKVNPKTQFPRKKSDKDIIRSQQQKIERRDNRIEAQKERIKTQKSAKVGQPEVLDDRMPIRIFGGELSENGENTYTKLKQMVYNLSDRTGTQINVSIVTPNNSFNGVTVKGRNIYISADVLENADKAENLLNGFDKAYRKNGNVKAHSVDSGVKHTISMILQKN